MSAQSLAFGVVVLAMIAVVAAVALSFGPIVLRVLDALPR